MRILILAAHPKSSQSIAQRALTAAAQAVHGVTCRDLYAIYPDFNVDAAAEQAILQAHDVIVLQHPFYWYSSPALVKEWLDIVLESGWAYGPGGNKMHGKSLLSAISTGGAESFYHAKGRNRFTVEELLAPFNQTAYLCGMAYLKPFVLYEGRKKKAADLAHEAQRFGQLLHDIAQDRLDLRQHLATGYVLPDSFKRRQA
ncbi:MAG: NAD(P)H oxidoreductase [Phyllobacteriaceae bacterium]|jgi:glutathione-regulated potassium-efflux system ancillary protein KefG|nr:NAD(P)H oxidoreductase [Phyllobacteriaceae bacterium]